MREKASKRMKNNHKYFGSNFVEREKFAKSVGEIKKNQIKIEGGPIQ
jgi:REP element-mobilizing transposase RayT